MWPWLAWAVVLLIADQVTKTLILDNYRLGDSTFITGFFNIVRAHNTGAAFSFLAFVSERLATLDGVLSTGTHFMLKTYKQDGVLMDGEKADDRLQVSP